MNETAQSPPEQFYCRFCQKAWPSPRARGSHEAFCEDNPAAGERIARRNATLAKSPARAIPRREYTPGGPTAEWLALSDEDPEPTLRYRSIKPEGRELDEWESKIVELLCKQGKYESSVTLAADLYETTVEVQASRVLQWNLVELILADLNELGLVRYRLKSEVADDTDVVGRWAAGGEVFVRIRPTSFAYEWAVDVLGLNFPWKTTIGQGWHSLRERPAHEGDMTDFRSHTYHANPSPVVKEDFIEHCTACDHLNKHRRQLIELFGTDQL